MRPPLIAGENPTGELAGSVQVHASMRPPLIAGENIDIANPLAVQRAGTCFNEAPADRGGKHP